MRLIHSIQNHRIEKETSGLDQSGFVLTNNAGGYLWQDERPQSRYQGFFFAPKKLLGTSIIKVVEDIAVVGAPKVWEIENRFFEVSRTRGFLRENFFVPKGLDALVYEIDHRAAFDLYCDARAYDDHGEWERHYDIALEKGGAVIRYTHPGLPLKELYIAVRTDGEASAINEWVKRVYDYDRKRNSPPYERWVLLALRCRGKKMVLAVAENRASAHDTAAHVFRSSATLKTMRRRDAEALFSTTASGKKREVADSAGEELLVAAFAAAHSLKSLCVRDGTGGLYAGLPWFFQFWDRDTAVSLKALAAFDWVFARELFFDMLERLEKNGFASPAADDYGWLFLRARDLMTRNLLSKKELDAVAFVLEKTLENDLNRRTRCGFAENGPGATWMDTIPRAGARLEVQALRLNMLALAAAVSKTHRTFYSNLEGTLRENARKEFFNGRFLADGFDCERNLTDFTIRPNIFLAAYVYPRLLEPDGWRACFKYAVRHLWREWGGLSSIDSDDPAFCHEHTGENPASYHNGDSWFYANNIAAIAMKRCDPSRFGHHIGKIFRASTYDLLWSGVLGHSSEVSPAGRFDSSGALAQAWSGATYLEMASDLTR